MSKPRSYDQHKRFFAVIGAAFEQWPEKHPFQPDSAEHLRAWLLIKARHRVVADFHLGNVTEEFVKAIPAIVFAMFRKHVWCWQVKDVVRCCCAESISYDTLGHNAFCVLNNEVDDVIRAETKLDPDQLLRQRDNAA